MLSTLLFSTNSDYFFIINGMAIKLLVKAEQVHIPLFYSDQGVRSEGLLRIGFTSPLAET
jgi:hypothetical protein